MAFFECNFFSESLRMCSSMYVILPQPTSGQIGMKGVGSADGCPVLYLLHGMSDDHTIWLRRTSIERYAAQYGIAVVMPNVHRSFYNDMPSELNYWNYVSNELPQIVANFFKFSQKREDTFAAGLSMGGFGALKLGLNYPEKFAAVAGLSSVIRPGYMLSASSALSPELAGIFGDMKKIPNSVNDLYFKSREAVKKKTKLPKIFMACGTEDFLYKENLLFKAHLEELGIPLTYQESAGNHEWGFWDRYIQEVLRWLPIGKTPAKKAPGKSRVSKK